MFASAGFASRWLNFIVVFKIISSRISYKLGLLFCDSSGFFVRFHTFAGIEAPEVNVKCFNCAV